MALGWLVPGTVLGRGDPPRSEPRTTGGGVHLAREGKLGAPSQVKSLAFHNIHTGEDFRGAYWADGCYRNDALADIARVLRDYRTGEIKPIDTRLLNLLHRLAGRLADHPEERLPLEAPFQVISGYRSARTNALLRRRGYGVARNSLHLTGQAVDIRMPGVPLAELRRVAMSLRGGGVGYYPASNFAHIDVGPIRYW